MANSLGIEVKGKRVVMKGLGPEAARTIVVVGGFGAVPYTSGTALFGKVNGEGQTLRFNSWEIEKLAEGEVS